MYHFFFSIKMQCSYSLLNKLSSYTGINFHRWVSRAKHDGQPDHQEHGQTTHKEQRLGCRHIPNLLEILKFGDLALVRKQA